jgi:hypothetical protein
MYSQLKTDKSISRGNFFMLFKTKERAFLYLKSIAIGVPIWFMIGVLINLSPRFITVSGIDTKEMLGAAVMFTYIGLSAGDVLSGVLSQLLKSRKKVIYLYLFLSVILILYYLNTPVQSFNQFKISCLLLGIGTGYWALFVQVASENFGTNIRSTVTNTVPNFVRFSVVPITVSFKLLSESMSTQNAAIIVGSVCLSIALVSLYLMKETFSKDLNYHEID